MGFFPSTGATAMDSSKMPTVVVYVVIVVSREGDWNSANRCSPSSLEDSSAVCVFAAENFSLCPVQSFWISLKMLHKHSFLELTFSVTGFSMFILVVVSYFS